MSKKSVLYMGMVAIISVILVGCGNSVQMDKVPQEQEPIVTVEESLETLNNAKQISVEKEFTLFSNEYTIKVDGEKFGKVTGEVVIFGGDTFTLKDKDGNVLAKEEEKKRWGKFNREAIMYDKDNNKVGKIGEKVWEDLFKTGYQFHIFNEEDTELGYSKKEYFTMLPKSKLYNASNDEVAYEVNGKFDIMSHFEINVVDNSEIDVITAVFYTCILEAILTAEEKEKSDN